LGWTRISEEDITFESGEINRFLASKFYGTRERENMSRVTSRKKYYNAEVLCEEANIKKHYKLQMEYEIVV
jgi:hypothetical protein